MISQFREWSSGIYHGFALYYIYSALNGWQNLFQSVWFKTKSNHKLHAHFNYCVHWVLIARALYFASLRLFLWARGLHKKYSLIMLVLSCCPWLSRMKWLLISVLFHQFKGLDCHKGVKELNVLKPDKNKSCLKSGSTVGYKTWAESSFLNY